MTNIPRDTQETIDRSILDRYVPYRLIDLYTSISIDYRCLDGRLIQNSKHSFVHFCEALSRDKITKESLAEFGLVEAGGRVGIWEA